jgi:hypothetical protein
MPEIKNQGKLTIAIMSLAVSICVLAVTIGVGIWKAGAMYGTISNEHTQIFRELKELADKKCP